MKDMISVASGFQYSVNIGYDLGNEDKLRNFIPTKSALSLLEEILLSTSPASNERARVLIGAYGKGKSHIVLTILSMLLKKDLALFERLMPKVAENPRLLQLVHNYYDSENTILPVVISGSNTSLTQAFLLSLQRTLSENDLLDCLPETNYKAAVQVIRRWENEFPDTYNKFKEMIDEPIEVLVDKLTNYDVVAYESFEKAYPMLTSGSLFNPFLGFDVVDLYESVAKSLKARGFTGIYVVYDEFSKFLEANITDASVSDTKMLQDFAEKCNRSGDLQMHLMLISHKEIANYIDKLPKEKVDGWRGVSERFKHIHLNNNFSQTYEIISSVIQHHEPIWGEFCAEHEQDFDSLFARYQKHQIFIDAQGELDTAIVGCFPLHPVSTFILPRLSERVAQNERTLFTFLSADGAATLPAFINTHSKDKFWLITPDQIYDYFEPLFMKEVYSGDIHDTYILTSNILAQLDENTLGAKIVKTLSLIYILEQFERLSPTKEQIIGIYSAEYSVDEIEAAISDLVEKEFVVYIKRSNDYLRLKQTSGVDIQQKIRDQVESLSLRIAVKDVLNNSNFDNYMYPSRYNDEREMTRYFAFQFISSSEVTANVDWDIKSEQIKADGIVYGIVPDSAEDLLRVRTIIHDISTQHIRYLFVLPKKFKPIDGIAKEFSAVLHLRDQAADDPVLFDEYEVIFEDLQEIIKSYINSYTHPESYQSLYIHDGKRVDARRKSALTELLSSICDEVYSLTPVINNEAVNKNDITSIAVNSRTKIISGLLRSELEPNLGLSGTGQEVSIMRSTLMRTGIWAENDGKPELNLAPENEHMRDMLEAIEQFILETGHVGKQTFGVLYDRLTLPEYHFGLRLGVIPIYLAAVLHKYRQQTVIADRFGPVSTSADVLLQINSAPEQYFLEYLEWDQEKENYISRLEHVFENYVIEAEKASNSYDYVANAMRRWYMALPKYSKECKVRPNGEKIVKRQTEMLKALRLNENGTELLFKKFPEAFGYTGDFTADVAEDIITAKNVYDGLLGELKQYLASETKDLFTPPESNKAITRKTSLMSTMREWSESLDPKSFEQLFQDGTDRFLQLLSTATDDEELFIARLAKLATGLRLEDWDNKTDAKYIASLTVYRDTAKQFHQKVVAETINDTSSYQVTFADEEGNNTTRRFDKVTVSPKGKLLFNQITAALDSMGHSISEQEKRQVLMEVLKKIC